MPLGTELPPQKSHEAATLPCKHHEETPEPKDTVKQSDTPCPPAPSAVAPRNGGDQSSTSRGTWHRSRSWHPASPDPADDPNDWVLAYMVKKDELLSWWLEFLSVCRKGARPLSDAQVQELARKQAVGFRLPAAQ